MEFEDDQTISDDDYLLRRLIALPIPKVKQIVWDNNRDCWMPSSAAFDQSEMSVTIEKDLIKENLTYQDIIDLQTDQYEYGMVKFQAGIARAKGQKVLRDPKENEPAHGLVVGNKKKAKKAIKAASEWVVNPPPGLPKE